MKSVSAHERLWGDRRGWDERPLLRELYLDWFGMMASHLRPGRTVELGSGPGRFAERCEGVIATDIVDFPWLDVVLDATRLPFGEGKVDNLVMLDVFHHLDVVSFLDEAGRVLSPGGRVVMIEPYISAFSYLIYHFVLDEPTRMKGTLLLSTLLCPNGPSTAIRRCPLWCSGVSRNGFAKGVRFSQSDSRSYSASFFIR